MSRLVNNIEISTDTFAVLVTKTNELLTALSTEIVTTSNTVYGANTSGNTNIIGSLYANVVGTSNLRGGASGNTANVSTLTIGFSNSTVSSNVVLTGYVANLTSNTLNISSNANLTGAELNITSTTTATGNTTFKANSSVDTIRLYSNTSDGIGIGVNADSLTINATAITIGATNTIHTGNFVLKNFATANAIALLSNSSYTNLHITANVTNIASNLELVGVLHTITGNVNFSSNTLFIDYVNGHVAFGHTEPLYPVHVKESNTTVSLASFEHSVFNTEVEIRGELGDVNGNTGVIRSGEDDHLKLVSDYGSGGYIFIAANGSIGFNNSNPSSALTVTGTGYISGNTVIDGGIDVEGEAIFANSITFSDRVSFVSNTSNVSHTDTITAALIDTIDVSVYQSAKYTITAQDRTTANNISMTEINLVYGADQVFTTEYGTIYTTLNNFVSYSANANTTHVRLYVNALDLSTANSINYKLVRTTTK